MKNGLVFASMFIIALGIWMIGSGFNSTGPSAGDLALAENLSATPVTTGSPVLIGTLLMAAGVLFMVIVSRRK